MSTCGRSDVKVPPPRNDDMRTIPPTSNQSGNAVVWLRALHVGQSSPLALRKSLNAPNRAARFVPSRGSLQTLLKVSLTGPILSASLKRSAAFCEATAIVAQEKAIGGIYGKRDQPRQTASDTPPAGDIYRPRRAQRASAIEDTQKEAIERARAIRPESADPHRARARY